MGQFAIIGLGNFAHYLAEYLCKKRHEVLAIDTDSRQVQKIKDKVSQAVVADATDREAMHDLGVDQMDAVIVCIRSNMSNSILATLNMKDIGANRIIAMATSEDHGRVLDKIGASEFFFPERDMAISMAERLHNPNMLDYLPFIEGYSIIQLAPPQELIGKALHELDLINQYSIQVIGAKDRETGELNLIPKGNFVLSDRDILILLGPNEALEKLKGKRQ
jgi:trk system potassium uptake protein TrkA